LIMTTNAGASDAAKDGIGFGRGKRDDEAGEAIKRLFTPEFRNRLDAIIQFTALTPEIVANVVDKFIIQLEEQLSDRQVEIELSDAARAWLAVRGYDPAMGARPLGRLIQEHIKKPLADELLFGKLKKGGLVRVDVDPQTSEKLAFFFEPALPKPARKSGSPKGAAKVDEDLEEGL
jgi:ATP-dependent Clp protease ATP-binding subunit ClpA